MKSKSITGGNMEFVHDEEDSRSVRSEDTESTVGFKRSLAEWQESRKTILGRIKYLFRKR